MYYVYALIDNRTNLPFYNFCDIHDLSVPTMEKIMRNKKIPTRGSCKGWFVEKYNSTISTVTPKEEVTE